VRPWWRKRGTIVKRLLQGYFVPAGDLQRVKVINDCQGIELVQAGYNIAIFNVRQSADVQNEIRPAALGGDFKAGRFHIPVR
jgi:hypothetical protein